MLVTANPDGNLIVFDTSTREDRSPICLPNNDLDQFIIVRILFVSTKGAVMKTIVYSILLGLLGCSLYLADGVASQHPVNDSVVIIPDGLAHKKIVVDTTGDNTNGPTRQ